MPTIAATRPAVGHINQRGRFTGSSPAGTACQNAFVQARDTAYRVSNLDTPEPATRTHAKGVALEIPACISPTLPKKPDIGGMPAKFIAETKNSRAKNGASRANPPNRSKDVVPPCRSTKP